MKPREILNARLRRKPDPMSCPHKKWTLSYDRLSESCDRCGLTIRSKTPMKELE